MKTNKSFSTTGRQEILVPIDFTESSVKALRHAAGLAAGSQVHLTLVNVDEETVSFRRLDLADKLRKRREERTSQMAELLRRELGSGVAADLIVCVGRPATEIARLATQLHADLIVLGRHMHLGLRRWFHGHTASRVADTATCPVVVLNGNNEPQPHKIAA